MKTTEQLAEAIVKSDDLGFARLEQKWGIGGLEVIAKLAAEYGLITVDQFHAAKNTLQW